MSEWMEWGFGDTTKPNDSSLVEWVDPRGNVATGLAGALNWFGLEGRHGLNRVVRYRLLEEAQPAPVVNAKQDGGPAFPCEYGYGKRYKGASLRDYFAAKAMQAYTSDPAFPWDQTDKAAQRAYQMADAMLAEREK